MAHEISLVIPAFNERDNLRPLISMCLEALEPFPGTHEIIVVNDGSTDGTGELLDELAKEHPIIRPVHHPPGNNIGCHPSELEALKLARGRLALFLPADLQIEPSVLPAFVEAAESADVVASRRYPRADPWIRRAISAVNNIIERVVLGIRVRDAHSSMLLTRRAIDELVGKVRSDSALIPAEILVRAHRAGLRIREIDIPHRPRVAGSQTGVALDQIASVPLDLLRLRRRLR